MFFGEINNEGTPFEKIFVVWNNQNEITNVELFLHSFNSLNETFQNKIEKSETSPFFQQISQQFREYFNRERKSFDLPLHYSQFGGFYQNVWKELLQIPYGETKSYKEIAEAVGKPKAARAIGQANRKNPIPILIPCHRVLASNGKLGGYCGAHLNLKTFLLSIEKNNTNNNDQNNNLNCEINNGEEDDNNNDNEKDKEVKERVGSKRNKKRVDRDKQQSKKIKQD